MEENGGLAREVAALRERLSRLSEASLSINESLDFGAVLQGVLDSARSLTGARYSLITTLDQGGQVEDFLVSGLSADESRQLWELPEGLRFFERLSNLPGPLRTADFASHMRSLGLPEFRPPVPVSSFLAAPIRHRGEGVGNIYVAKSAPGTEFTPEDEETLVMFASQAALVIANARRHRQEQRARAGLETLIDTSPVGVVVFDAQTGVPVSINLETRRILGDLRTPGGDVEQLLETLTFRRADGREVSLEEFPLARALRTGETVRAEEIVVQVPDGRSVTTLINATPIRSEDGEVESVVVTLQDLTPLEDLERLRAEFLAMVSHELRAPLTSIKGSAATVLGLPSAYGPAEMVQFFRIIDQQADHLSGLINDLLDVARLETGTLSVSPEPALLAALVDQARSAFLSGGAQHSIRIDLPPELPRVLADPRRIAQVLGNLLSNAARHSPGASPIRVSAASDEFQVAVTVADQGSGVPAERLPLLFRKFSRIEGEEQEGDTGLGLAISKGIVEAHGGRIWAESAGPGQGARFTFTLPVAEEARVAARTSRRPSRRRSADLERQRNAQPEQVRVLAVDDDPHALRYIRDTLAGAGYLPLVTADPEEAVRLTGANHPHLALLDLMLPGTDGIQLMREIQAVASVPVIFLSAYGQEDVVARAFDQGAADYVVKPFSPTELAARIRAALRKRAAAGEPEPEEPYVRGDLVIDYGQRSVSVGGSPVRLAAIEYRLLAELAAHAGQALSYERLLERVWGQRGQADLRPMRSAVRSLRRKLGDDAAQPAYIFTEPRIGYRMAKGEGQQEPEGTEGIGDTEDTAPPLPG